MRIITGRARGVRLKAPKGMATRPTSDRVKESLFSILTPFVAGREVLDIFAGTGGLGLEALSRGARRAVFIDEATQAVISDNIRRCRLEGEAEILPLEATAALARLARSGRQFDLVFCDPPYRRGLAERVLTLLDEGTLLGENAIVVVEQGGGEPLPPLKELVCVDTRTYGHTTQVRFLQRRSYLAQIEEEET